jgi:hypothetical protein
MLVERDTCGVLQVSSLSKAPSRKLVALMKRVEVAIAPEVPMVGRA